MSAEDGSILWETIEWKIRIANVPTPVVIEESLIFLSGGYNAGCMMLRLSDQDGSIVAEQEFRLKPEVFGAAQQTPIFYKGHIYGIRQDGQLICLDVKGSVLWTSTSAHKFGLGPYIIADEKLYVMNDSGVLSLVEADASGFVLLDRAKVLDGHESWGPMTIVQNRLIVRDLTKMVCLDIGEQ